jgi:ubiquinone/menaquinone biosynthesis C-methylase UbiE
MESRHNAVKSFFDQPSRYLKLAQCDIRVRAETVQEFLRGVSFSTILDIGCGDGSISLPLLRDDIRITLLDLSAAMLTLARSKCRKEWVENITIVNEDFMTRQFTPASYELIVCLGVLAHVDSPEDVIAKMVTLLKPQGKIILEFTDSQHFIKRVSTTLRKYIGPRTVPTYSFNFLSFSLVAALFAKYRVKCESIYRYSSWSLPGTHRFFPQSFFYSAIRLVFGNVDNNRNGWLGNEYICFLSRQE